MADSISRDERVSTGGGPSANQEKIRCFNTRLSGLRNEGMSWFDHWRDIARYSLPRAGRFLQDGSQSNRGAKKHNDIYDNTIIEAIDVCSAGLMSGLTSPARPWFRLQTPDQQLNNYHSVKNWLDDVAVIMRAVFAGSNTYRTYRSMYEALATFGTAVDLILDDYEKVIHHYPFEIGEFWLGCDDKGHVNTVYREFDMQVHQLIERFGKENVTQHTLNKYRDGKGAIDAWIPVVHVIEPRKWQDREYGRRDVHNMPWCSTYYEAKTDEGKLLRESGFRQFPAAVARWQVRGRDAYGESPGMKTLGDNKQLQHEQLRKAQAIDFQTRPPVGIPTQYKNREPEYLPGGSYYYDAATGAKPGAIFQSTLQLNELKEDILDVRQRIQRGYYTHIFMMLANDVKAQPDTARAIAEKHEEKMVMLGPILESLQDESLGPNIDITFARCLSAGLLPPPPPELNGMDLSVQYISVLAQAQRAVGLGAVDRLLGTVALLAPSKPDVWDKIDTDEAIDSYADMLGVDPNLIVADEQVALVRADRAKREAAAQQAQEALIASQSAKNLAQSPTTGGNALSDVTRMFSGYTTG